MDKGYKFGMSVCPDCGEEVADNWYVRHRKEKHPQSSDELVARCDLCKEPLGASLSVELWKWVLHPECATVAKARLERFAPVIFDTTDEEFEAWLKDESGEWARGGAAGVEYEAEAER